MGSLLGNYVHYSWANYENYGTYRSVRGWQTDERQKSNFQDNIFENHKQATLKIIEGLRQPNLKALETDFNTQVKYQANKLQELKNNAPAQYNLIVDEIIKSLGATYTAISNKIAQNLVWDEARQTFRYSLAAGANSDNIETPPYYNLKVVSGRGESRPRIKYCKELIQYIIQVSGNPKHQDILDLQMIIKALEDNEASYKKQKSITQKLGIEKKGQIKYYDLSFSMAKNIDTLLQSIRGGYIEAVDIDKKVQAAFSEFIGNVIGQNLTIISKKAIVQALQVGKTKTIKNVNTSGMTITMDTSAIESWMKESSRSAARLGSKVNGKKNKVSYDFYATLGEGVDQKADIQVTLSGQMYGISMKNTSFYAQSSQNNFLIPHVSLQSSVLSLYLAAIQKDYPDLGNHYLNIFANHKDAAGPTYSRMRKDANEALTLYILYSALSGQGQLRSNRGTANIFAIYDKSSSKDPDYRRVKFFDMADILTRFNQFSNNHSVLKPPLNTFIIKNDWDTTSTARITKVLLQTRTSIISATLSTEMLRNLYVK